MKLVIYICSEIEKDLTRVTCYNYLELLLATISFVSHRASKKPIFFPFLKQKLHELQSLFVWGDSPLATVPSSSWVTLDQDLTQVTEAGRGQFNNMGFLLQGRVTVARTSTMTQKTRQAGTGKRLSTRGKRQSFTSGGRQQQLQMGHF